MGDQLQTCVPRQLLPRGGTDVSPKESASRWGEARKRARWHHLPGPRGFGLLFLEMVAGHEERSPSSRTVGTRVPPNISGLLNQSDFDTRLHYGNLQSLQGT